MHHHRHNEQQVSSVQFEKCTNEVQKRKPSEQETERREKRRRNNKSIIFINST